MLLLSSNIFPWDSLAYHFKIFNALAQIQFPWRYMIYATIFQTILMAVEIEEHLPEVLLNISNSVYVKYGIVVSVIMAFLFTSFYADNARRTMYYDTYDANTYWIMNGEYLRTRQVDNHIDYTIVDDFTGRFDKGSAKSLIVNRRNGTDFDIACATGNEGTVIVAPLINYKGYIVYDDSGNTYDIADSDNNLVSFFCRPIFRGISI